MSGAHAGAPRGHHRRRPGQGGAARYSSAALNTVRTARARQRRPTRRAAPDLVHLISGFQLGLLSAQREARNALKVGDREGLMAPVSFVGLLIVALVAFLAPLLLGLSPARRLPRVVIEIVAGIVIGPSVLGWVSLDL